MQSSIRLGSAVVILLWAGVPLTRSQAPPTDRVLLGNTTASPAGLLVSGRTAYGYEYYHGFAGPTGTVSVGTLAPSSATDEIAAFTVGRAVTVQSPVVWTAAGDNVSVSFADEIAIPVTMWIVRGNFVTRSAKAATLASTAETIWLKERMGIRFSSFDIMDATTNPRAPMYATFNCNNQAQLLADIPPIAQRINIYMVGSVDGSAGNANACANTGSFVAIGTAAGATLLAHEIGHVFNLTHIDDLTSDFDEKNVMHPYSNTRSYLTEGQTFRAHVSSYSALNLVYPPGTRSGPVRPCPRDVSSDLCPPIRKRIWADGSFPAN